VSKAIWAMAKSLKKGRRRVTVRNTNSGLPGNALRQTALASAALLVLLLWTCGAASGAVRLNQIQVVGTHNSYHVEASPAEKALRIGSGLIDESTLEYGFPPLTEQLDLQGVRQIELDVWADPVGGLYAAPRLRTLALEGPYDPAMLPPGIKVLHVQDYDYRSTCLSLAACLQEVKAWSDAHPGHVPLAILVELKDTALPPPIPATVPLAWTRVAMDALDAEIRAVFPPERLIVPDTVRGRRRTLEAAVLRDGWPALAANRGKVLFLMDNAAPYRTRYLRGHPSLRGRVLFTNSAPGLPDAAFIKANDPRGAELARIRRAVRLGYVVRTRADQDTREARSGDMRRARRALASGAQWVSTDYPAPGIAARFGTDYVVRLPRPARCNPVSAPRSCRSGRLDRAR
jgi:Phosphoinositide phospholipase C, Ca2+-dependent